MLEPNRRRDCLADPFLFLKTYFPEIFYQPFTPDRKEMVEALAHATQYGGDQAVAGPRADGKTRVALFTTVQQLLKGSIEFPVIISKSGPRASRELRNVKDAITTSPLLAADFPEVVEPIIALGRWAARARQQTAFGVFTDMEWGEECVIFPTIPTHVLHAHGWNDDLESAARGQIFASLGIEGPIRGYSVRNRRPDLAILDDIDDRESARSELQTETRERIIEEDVGGLAGPDKTIARVMLCTLINQKCIAATFTDRSKKSSWRGQRHRLVEKWPDREDLWAEYMQLRQDRGHEDPDARVAQQFYADRRAEMDAGAVVTNPYRFDHRKLEDGSQAELSALQACYNLIADRGREHFDTEYQNDPPEEAGPIEPGITPQHIQRKVTGYGRRIVPPGGKVVILQGIDPSKRALHWTVRAYRLDGSAFYTIDYGVTDVLGTKPGTDKGVDIAVRRAILARWDETRDTEYIGPDGEILQCDLTLVDCGWLTSVVQDACAEIGKGILPVMGFGKSSGCAHATFREPNTESKSKKYGDGFFLQPKQRPGKKRVVMVGADVDRWKLWEHDRWMTPVSEPGSMQIFGEGSDGKELSADEKAHHTYAHHICNEVEVEEMIKGVLRRRWHPKGANHWLDSSTYCNVAAAMKGIRLQRRPRKPDPATAAQAAPAPAQVRTSPAKPRAKRKRKASSL